MKCSVNSIKSGGSKMSGSGSKRTKPVPTPRRGNNRLSRKRLAWEKYTVRQFWEWMDKLGKCVCCAYQKRRNVTKVGRPTEKRTFCCPRGRRIFLNLSSPCEMKVRNRAAMLSYNYCDWKEWVNPLIPIRLFVIWLCKSLSVKVGIY